jgi:hypothetical protein
VGVGGAPLEHRLRHRSLATSLGINRNLRLTFGTITSITMHSYFAFGLHILSDLELPELVPADGQPDVIIRFGDVDWQAPDDLDRGHHATAEEIYFFWKDVGTFVVRGGHEVVIQPVPDVENHILRLFILGTVLAGVLHQRGLLVLHASAVMMNGGAVAFLGHRGWGKSTMAASLRAREHPLVADDLVVVDLSDPHAITVMPGFPQFKLWPDAVASLGVNPEELPKLHPLMDKRAYHIGFDFIVKPLPLKSIYVLDLDDNMKIETIEQREAFIELVRHTYLVRYLEDTGASPLHFRQCSVIAEAVPIFRLKRPSSLSLLPSIAKTVEDNLTLIAL